MPKKSSDETSQSERVSRAEFHRHLENNAQTVRDMPTWKRRVITGRVSRKTET